MNNTTLFIEHPTNFQFLSVCHYINSFGLFFYNLDLISLEHRNHSSAVLNTYFEYIQKWENPNEGKLNLLQRVLKGSDLYGGGENETLDMKYVDETYQYIISNALFSHYGNIRGYLAEIINGADNITYLALKERVYQHFSKYYTSRDYCSSRYESYELTQLTVDKVFHENIWSMFPAPNDNNKEILDVDYIYAMVGLKIFRSIQTDDGGNSSSYDDFILLARAIEFDTFNNETYQLAMDLFSTPALFYHVHTARGKYTKRGLVAPMKMDKFWQTAYEEFFHFFNLSLQEAMKLASDNSLHYKLQKELDQLESRTFIAAKVLEKFCRLSTIQNVSPFWVSIYKSFPWILKYRLPENCHHLNIEIPDLDQLYDSQFNSVRELFNEIEQHSLEQVLQQSGLGEKMNLNTTVKIAQVPNYPIRCMYCSPTPRKINTDIYILFGVIENNREDFYALRQENNTLALLTSNGNKREFSRALTNYSSLEMEISNFAKVLKYPGENYKSFIQRVADMKTQQFVQGLMNFYREPTDAEKVLDFLKSLVPFYTCIKSVKAGNRGGVALSCGLDVVSLLPIAGVVGKYSSLLWSGLIAEVGERTTLSIISKSVIIGKSSIMTGIGQIYKSAIRTVSREILNLGLLKDLSIASLRTVDPGFELFYQASGFFSQLLRKMIRNLAPRLGNIPQIRNLLLDLQSIINQERRLIPDHTGLVPVIHDRQYNYNTVRYLYPGGSNYFGPKCLSIFDGTTAELRTVEDELLKVPVVAMKTHLKDSTTYREYYSKLGKISSEKLEIGPDDILQRVGTLIQELATQGKVLRNYHVYHNTIEWKTQPGNSKQNLAVTERSADSESPNDTPGTSRSVGNYFFQEYPERTVKLLNQFRDVNGLGLSNLKEHRDVLHFQKSVNSIDLFQSAQEISPPKDLWFSQTLTRPSIVNVLKNLKEKDFYFNDLTLLTDIEPSEIITKIPNKIPRYSLKTEVRYHVEFDSQYGFVDLANAFGDNFKNQYIVFPEVNFFVTDTKYLNGKEILQVELKSKGIIKQEWLQVIQMRSKFLERREIVQTERSEQIETAARFIAANTPLQRFIVMERFLKNYVLKLKTDDKSPVPTYDTLAREIHSGNSIPEVYNQWKIENNIFVNDVLFEKTLHQVGDFKTAKETINHVYGGIYSQVIEPVFAIYQSSSVIKYSMRFEDYYVIYSFFCGTLSADVHASRRVAAAIGRLALRQYGTQLITVPLTVYFAVNIPKSVFTNIIRQKTGADINFSKIQPFYVDRENVVSNCRATRPSEVLVLYELKMRNRDGIADLTYILQNREIQYYLPHETTLTILERNRETIEGRSVFVLTLSVDKLPSENRMVKLVHKLNELFASDTKFYLNV